ncbi:unnamed protein product, partial [Meganyctiphanes norvegica]
MDNSRSLPENSETMEVVFRERRSNSRDGTVNRRRSGIGVRSSKLRDRTSVRCSSIGVKDRVALYEGGGNTLTRKKKDKVKESNISETTNNTTYWGNMSTADTLRLHTKRFSKSNSDSIQDDLDSQSKFSTRMTDIGNLESDRLSEIKNLFSKYKVIKETNNLNLPQMRCKSKEAAFNIHTNVKKEFTQLRRVSEEGIINIENKDYSSVITNNTESQTKHLICSDYHEYKNENKYVESNNTDTFNLINNKIKNEPQASSIHKNSSDIAKESENGRSITKNNSESQTNHLVCSDNDEYQNKGKYVDSKSTNSVNLINYQIKKEPQASSLHEYSSDEVISKKPVGISKSLPNNTLERPNTLVRTSTNLSSITNIIFSTIIIDSQTDPETHQSQKTIIANREPISSDMVDGNNISQHPVLSPDEDLNQCISLTKEQVPTFNGAKELKSPCSMKHKDSIIFSEKSCNREQSVILHRSFSQMTDDSGFNSICSRDGNEILSLFNNDTENPSHTYSEVDNSDIC